MVANTRQHDFAAAAVGKDGCLYKAGLQDTDTDVNGYGLGYDNNEWIGATGTPEFSKGGIRFQVEGTDQMTVTPPSSTAREQAIRDGLANRGSLQLDLYVTDLTSRRTTLGEVLRTYFVTNTRGIATLSHNVDESAGGAMSCCYDKDGNQAYTNPIYLVTHSSSYRTDHSVQSLLFYDELADADGYATLTISWDGDLVEFSINGAVVGRHYRAATNDTFSYIRLQDACLVAMRNLLIYDRPLPMADKVNGLRVVLLGHSFMQRNSYAALDPTGQITDQNTQAHADSIPCRLLNQLQVAARIQCYGFSGQDLAYLEARVDGGAIAYDKPVGSNYQDHVSRHRPHFCVILGHGNDTISGTNIATSVHDISKKLIQMGCIPVWVTEHNRVHLASPIDYTDVSGVNQHAAYMAEVQRQQAVNDMGLADVWDATGGAGGNPLLLEYETAGGSASHPNFQGQRIYADAIAAEIARLHADPPSYSRLANPGAFGHWTAIASP